MIDDSAVMARLEQLRSERQSLLEQMAMAERKIVAYDGAIEDCEHWLAELRKDQDDEDPISG